MFHLNTQYTWDIQSERTFYIPHILCQSMYFIHKSKLFQRHSRRKQLHCIVWNSCVNHFPQGKETSLQIIKWNYWIKDSRSRDRHMFTLHHRFWKNTLQAFSNMLSESREVILKPVLGGETHWNRKKGGMRQEKGEQKYLCTFMAHVCTKKAQIYFKNVKYT